MLRVGLVNFRYLCGEISIMDCDKLHRFDTSIEGIELPHRLNNPFEYTPHPLAKLATAQVMRYVGTQKQWTAELAQGKMLGVLVVADRQGAPGFLAAYSGNLAGSNSHSYFVPPIYDLLAQGGEFKQGEAEISAINARIAQLQTSPAMSVATQALHQAEAEKTAAVSTYKRIIAEAKTKRDRLRAQGALSPAEERMLIGESQFQKAELKRIRQRHDALIAEKQSEVKRLSDEISHLKMRRKRMSEALQKRIFQLFVVSDACGERCDLTEVFARFYQANPTLRASSTPPSGAGECCAPKLLQYAFTHQLKPLCIAEFWWGKSPAKEIRHHGHYYGACLSKCRPILAHMLRGIDIEPQQHERKVTAPAQTIIYQDQWLVVANKPAGMPTVPGRLHDNSLQTHLAEELGIALKAVHRLDMSTSGIVILAKSAEVYTALQAQFADRSVAKRYIALLEGFVKEEKGIVSLPLSADLADRPRQMVDYEHGKRAVTAFEVLSHTPDGSRTRIAFYPQTGRTHQLRVHASHHCGLGCPIVGDMLYGHADTRLMLHAERVTFTHPASGERLTFIAESPF